MDSKDNPESSASFVFYWASSNIRLKEVIARSLTHFKMQSSNGTSPVWRAKGGGSMSEQSYSSVHQKKHMSMWH